MNKEALLHKWLNGEATKAEVEELKSDPEYSAYVKIGDASQGFSTIGFNKEGNFEKIATNKSKGKPVSSFSVIWKVAAVAAVLVAAYFFLYNTNTKVSTSVAEKEQIVLPDNSEVVLNSESKLEYRKKDWHQNRELSLQGEAYFKVEKGSTFSVTTENETVQVLGTQFNVFSRNDYFTVTCYEGLVAVTYNGNTVRLPEGNELKVFQKKLINKTATNALAPSWIANESSFESAPIKEVINELIRQYPITITASELPNSNFTGSFTHTNLELALQSICMPLQLQYTINGKEVILYAAKNR